MQAFINELSLPSLPASVDVVNLFDALAICFKEAYINGVRELKVHSTFYNHQFAPGYTFLSWIADNTADEEKRTLLNSVLNTTPYCDDIILNYEKASGSVLDMKHAGLACVGLGLASEKLMNTIAFSYDEGKWSQSTYPTEIIIAEEDANGDLIETKHSTVTKNISSSAHELKHRGFIQSIAIREIANGKELWLRRTDLFPNLDFCNSVKKQIEEMNATELRFKAVVERLLELQDVARSFDGTPVTPASFRSTTTPESASRINSLGAEFTFLCPDGTNRLFSWHARYTPGAGRIHFVPFEAANKILIGYIGIKIQ